MLVLCKFKCMYINPAFCRVRATGGTQIVSSTSAFRRTSEIQMPSLVSVLMCRHFSVPVTSFDYQLRNTGVQESPGTFTHAAYLEIVSICFSLSHHVRFSYHSSVWWIFLRVKSSFSACDDRSMGIFLSFPLQNLSHRQAELVFTTTFLLCERFVFTLIFSLQLQFL